MKILELFAGTRSIGKAFEKAGHEVISVEWDKNFENINEYCDIGTLTAEYLTEKYGKFDIIWASPDCSSYSIAAISHHRRKNEETGNLDPYSDYAKFCDNVNKNVKKLIEDLKPKYYFTEKPKMEYFEWVDKKTGKTKRQATWYMDALKSKPSERAKIRSKTFPGIAKAMADQWCK